MNSLSLLIIEMIICYITLTIIYKFLKKDGLYIYSIIAIILSTILSLKMITIDNFDIPLGIIPFTTIFIANNILIQKEGPNEAKNLILSILFSEIISFFLLILVSYMNSSNINLFTNASYDNILRSSFRIVFANTVTILYTLIINAKLYYYLKRTQNNIIISNVFSTIIIHFLSAIIFSLIAYVFEKEVIDIIKIIVIRYLISLIIGLIGTIPLLITKRTKNEIRK